MQGARSDIYIILSATIKQVNDPKSFGIDLVKTRSLMAVIFLFLFPTSCFFLAVTHKYYYIVKLQKCLTAYSFGECQISWICQIQYDNWSDIKLQNIHSILVSWTLWNNTDCTTKGKLWRNTLPPSYQFEKGTELFKFVEDMYFQLYPFPYIQYAVYVTNGKSG